VKVVDGVGSGILAGSICIGEGSHAAGAGIGRMGAGVGASAIGGGAGADADAERIGGGWERKIEGLGL
jgi:hypothetical protein